MRRFERFIDYMMDKAGSAYRNVRRSGFDPKRFVDNFDQTLDNIFNKYGLEADRDKNVAPQRSSGIIEGITFTAGSVVKGFFGFWGFLFRQIVSIVFGSIIFVIFFFSLIGSLAPAVNVITAACFGVGFYFLMTALLKKKSKEQIQQQQRPAVAESPKPIEKPAAPKQEAKTEPVSADDDISRIIESMRKTAFSLSNPDVREKILSICLLMEKINADFKKNPKHMKYARRFVIHYLEPTERIVGQYAKLADQPVRNSEIDAMLKRAEEMLDDIREAAEREFADFLKDDLLNMDVELTVMEKMIKEKNAYK